MMRILLTFNSPAERRDFDGILASLGKLDYGETAKRDVSATIRRSRHLPMAVRQAMVAFSSARITAKIENIVADWPARAIRFDFDTHPFGIPGVLEGFILKDWRRKMEASAKAAGLPKDAVKVEKMKK